MANHVCYFEFMVGDVAKARAFYDKIFDWKFSQPPGMSGYTMIDTGKEPMGGMMKKPDQAPAPGLSIYFYVDSIDETLKKAQAAGARPGMPKTEIPNMGWWAFFFDPDGICVMIYESAKK
jgi:predicted enzyme related to lactoylglutathione lyase